MPSNIKIPFKLVSRLPWLSPESSRCIPLSGGRNNRAYRLETTSGTFFLKRYRQDGAWNRLTAESRFLRFCEKCRVAHVPRVLIDDVGTGVAIHSWLGGVPFTGGHPENYEINAACRFIRDLANAAKYPGALDGASPACDACLCLNDYFRSPSERLTILERLLAENPGAPCSAEALIFVREKLIPLWKAIRNSALTAMAGRNLSQPFEVGTLFYSPSDFGFHNIVRMADGKGLGFVDFEYAGLDDPVKLICDYQCQADAVMPNSAWESMLQACADGLDVSDPVTAEWRDRVRAVLPLTRMKFICIVLNAFKTYNKTFGDEEAERRSSQLEKAKRMYASLERHTRQFDEKA